MNVRSFIHNRVLPSPVVGGMRLSLWLRILYQNRFSVDLPFIPRAVIGTVWCGLESAAALYENIRFGRQIENLRSKPPIFILGHWRSGTSHLHKLLSVNPQFISPNTVQVFHPNSFLSFEKYITKIILGIAKMFRAGDRMVIGLDHPMEDEFALCQMTAMSPCIGWAFTRSIDRYYKYLTFDGIGAGDIAEWTEALQTFVKKIVFKDETLIPVLKSPQHTGRIRYLLEAFPDAKFIHVHRHPFDVFRSMVQNWIDYTPMMQLQRFDFRNMEELIIKHYRVIYEAFFEQCSLIPKDRFHEIRYEDLVADPVNELRKLYRNLDIPEFEAFRPALSAYLDSIRTYKTRKYDELTDEVKMRLSREWAQMFKAWNYTA